MAEKIVQIMLTSAVAIGGAVKIPGDILELDEPLAKNLLDRGRATLDIDARVTPENDLGDTPGIDALKASVSAAKGKVTKATNALTKAEGTDKESKALEALDDAEQAYEAAVAALEAAEAA